MLEGLLYPVGFIDKVSYLGLDLVWDLVLLAHLVECLHLAFLRFLVLLHRADQGSYVADIIGQGDAAESLNKNQYNGLVVVGCCEIAKTDSQHYIGAPVVPPYIFDMPLLVSDSEFQQPVIFIYIGHQVEENS